MQQLRAPRSMRRRTWPPLWSRRRSTC